MSEISGSETAAKVKTMSKLGGKKPEMEAKLVKLREDRIAREKARIEKLRALNMKKYGSGDDVHPPYMHANKLQEKPKNYNSMSDLATKQLPKSADSTLHSQHAKKQISNSSNVTRRTLVPISASKVPTSRKISATSSVASVLGDNVTSRKKEGFVFPKPVSTKSATLSSIKNDSVMLHNGSKIKHFDPAVLKKRTSLAPLSDLKAVNPKTASEETVDCANAPKDKVIKEISLPKVTYIENARKNRASMIPFKQDQSLPSIIPQKQDTQRASRKSMLPNYSKPTEQKVRPKTSPNSRMSIFDRLSKPKYITEKIDVAKKPVHEKKQSIIRTFGKKPQTCSVEKTELNTNMRRSISAVHFKRIDKTQMKNCIHKCSSIGAGLDKIDEDENKQDILTSAVKSERKMSKGVRFQKPTYFMTVNTPSAEELQKKLKTWLKKRGKSLDSYHHLQCFGIHHLAQTEKESSLQPYDDENKENIEVSDDRSHTELLNDREHDFDDIFHDNADSKVKILVKDMESTDSTSTVSTEVYNIKSKNLFKDAISNLIAENNDKASNFELKPVKNVMEGNMNALMNSAAKKWREPRPSLMSEATESNDSCHDVNTTSNSIGIPTPMHHIDDLILGALGDLFELIHEGFDWDQCARWLRAIRVRFPGAVDKAQYWECCAALEEQHGNFIRSCQCWEEAIVKGTKTSVAEASLDQLLDKFMQLNINPKTQTPETQKKMDSKMIDAKNVFKSTLIRFAVQKAKLKAESPRPTYTATPVRRSSRLSTKSPDYGLKGPNSGVKRTPLVQLCPSLRTLGEDVRETLVFVPNKTLQFSP